MALRNTLQLQSRENLATRHCHGDFKKPAVLPSRKTLGNVANKQLAIATNKKWETSAKPRPSRKQHRPTRLEEAPLTPQPKEQRSGDHIPQPMDGGDHTPQPMDKGDHTPQPMDGRDHTPQPMDKRDHTPQPMDIGEVATAVQRRLHMVEDVDEQDKENPLFCTEYVKDIYEYLRQLESSHHPSPSYMDQQPKINHKMRCILIDWLVLVQMKFQLLQETLFLTISIIDRFLEVFPVSKEQLQLVGVTAMLIASKYEEIYHPQLADFVYITDNTYTGNQVRQMERVVLETIGYNLATPAPIHFLRRFSKVAEVTAKIHTMAKFFLELSITDYSMLQFLPSERAAAALYFAMVIDDDCKPQWNPTMEYYSGYSKSNFLPCVNRMAKLVTKMTVAKQQSVREKYSNSRFLRVAKDPALFGKTVKEMAAHCSK